MTRTGAALMKMNSVMQSPESVAFRANIANGVAMRQGMDPSLAALAINQYQA